MSMTDKCEVLRKINLFCGLDTDALNVLAGQLVRKHFAPDETLCVEGEHGDRMFVIESGDVAVVKKGEGGVPIEITVLGAGQIAGEMCLLGHPVRSATLRAKTAVTVWVLDHATFQALLAQHAGLARSLLSCLTSHLQRDTSVIARLLSRDVDQRFRIAFFDSKPYMVDAFKESNRDRFAIQYLEPKLTYDTVSLAAGASAVCIFVNDTADEPVLQELASMNVRMVALRCAGYNNVDLAACKRLGISVARVPAYSPYAVAEHAVALMMALNRKIHRAHNRIREGNFSLNGLVGFDMHGKTAGVVGTGKIGKCVISILRGFGCSVLAYDKFPDAEFARQNDVQYVELPQVLAESDIVSLHAPLFPETHHMIDASAIATMKPGVMLINTSRGGLVDTGALVEGLKSGQVEYAGLDVYEEESAYFFEDFSDDVLTDDVLARLTTFNNVIVSSHQAFLTWEALGAIASTTLDNVGEFDSGKRGAELANAVIAE